MRELRMLSLLGGEFGPRRGDGIRQHVCVIEKHPSGDASCPPVADTLNGAGLREDAE